MKLPKLLDLPRRWLWAGINRVWILRWRQSALNYVREYWPEELLLNRIFEGKARFLRPRWWWVKLVCLTLPNQKS